MAQSIYATLLTEEQKEAFRKGDKYYTSPFKHLGVQRSLARAITITTEVYTTTTYTRIHEALVDSWCSKSWS